MSSPVKSVFVVQHSYELDGCGETKFIGVYTTRQAAEDGADEFPLDLDHWTEGFVTEAGV